MRHKKEEKEKGREKERIKSQRMREKKDNVKEEDERDEKRNGAMPKWRTAKSSHSQKKRQNVAPSKKPKYILRVTL